MYETSITHYYTARPKKSRGINLIKVFSSVKSTKHKVYR